MARLREDNARLTMEQERIIKSLSDKKNQQPLNPSAEQQRMSREQNPNTEPEESEGRDRHQKDNR